MNRIDWIFSILIFLECIGLLVAIKMESERTSSKWKMLYIFPLVTVLVFLGFTDFDICFVGAYLAGAVLLIGLFCEKAVVRTGACVAALMATIFSVCFASASTFHLYRCPHYVEEFETVFQELREYYCLAEHKRIDFDRLYVKYLPKFQEADREHDQILGCATFMEFAEEFYDGHVYYRPHNEKLLEKVYRRYLGIDYGLSLVKLEDGRYVAVNVETSLGEIQEGTPILLWDGKEPEIFESQIALHYEMSMPDQENDAFYRPFYIAGMGGDGNSISVTYEAPDGSAKEMTLYKVGDYYDRFKETVETIDQGRNIGHLEFEELDEDTVLFRLKVMVYDSHSSEEIEYPEMEKEIREKLLAYKDEGKKNLIMDLRGNGGGSPYMIETILKLLDREDDIFYCSNGGVDATTGKFIWNKKTGKYQEGYKLSYRGENLWNQGRIIVLTNAKCISGGDHMVYMMSKMDNATIWGFTPSNSSGQAVNPVILKSGMMSYSAVPILDEEGNILIDTDENKKTAIPLDVKISFDEEAIHSLFVEKEDYVLKQVMDTLQ